MYSKIYFKKLLHASQCMLMLHTLTSNTHTHIKYTHSHSGHTQGSNTCTHTYAHTVSTLTSLHIVQTHSHHVQQTHSSMHTVHTFRQQYIHMYSTYGMSYVSCLYIKVNIYLCNKYRTFGTRHGLFNGKLNGSFNAAVVCF